MNGANDLIECFDACHHTLSPLALSLSPSFPLTLSSSQIQCKSARAIAMETESVILVCAIASQDSTAWTAPKVLAAYKCVMKIKKIKYLVVRRRLIRRAGTFGGSVRRAERIRERQDGAWPSGGAETR